MINDGTACWSESLPLVKGLQYRAKFGRGYANPTLEEKRRRAIAYLREHSGWVVEKVIKRACCSGI